MEKTKRVGRAGAFAIAAAAAAWAAGAGCNRGQQQQGGPPQMPPPAVTAQLAAAADVPVYIDEIGKTAAREYVTVQPQVAGQVQAIHFADGADVKKGDLLFTIDPRPFEAAVAQAEANVAQQQASLDLAKQEFKRVEGLVQTRAISQQDYDQRKNAVAIAEAQVKAGEASIRTAKLNLEYCTIKSPIDGRAGQRMIDPGNVVKENDAPLVVVQRLDPVYADFTVPERELPRIRRHMADGTLKVEVTVPGQQSAAIAAAAGSAAAPGTQPAAAPTAPPTAGAPATAPAGPAAAPPPPRSGELTFLDTAVQQGLGTVKLRATLPNQDRYFWAGQFVNVRLVLETRKNAVLVPQQAVQIGQNGQYVFVVTAKGTAEMRPVRPGQRQGDQIVIETGVQAGDQVIVTGQNMLMPGGPVRVLPNTPPEGVAKL